MKYIISMILGGILIISGIFISVVQFADYRVENYFSCNNGFNTEARSNGKIIIDNPLNYYKIEFVYNDAMGDNIQICSGNITIRSELIRKTDQAVTFESQKEESIRSIANKFIEGLKGKTIYYFDTKYNDKIVITLSKEYKDIIEIQK